MVSSDKVEIVNPIGLMTNIKLEKIAIFLLKYFSRKRNNDIMMMRHVNVVPRNELNSFVGNRR